jgi:2-oxoglutarate dehydrogenase complex dehydrogenase (E1) component-like enzyme
MLRFVSRAASTIKGKEVIGNQYANQMFNLYK